MTARHHTKDKGDLAVAKVQADLIERGAIVLLPLTEHAPFDLVAYMDAEFYRVQVKFRSVRKGCVNVVFKSTWADRHGNHRRPVPMDAVDVIAIYCPVTAATYYLNRRDFRTSVNVRIEPAKNNQASNILAASSCMAFPPITNLAERSVRPDASDAA